jgi:hypothetical protein
MVRNCIMHMATLFAYFVLFALHVSVAGLIIDFT